jgi:hypothetical protein
LKDKPRVNYNDVELARPREDDNVAFMTIAKENEEPKEIRRWQHQKIWTPCIFTRQ